MSVTFWGVLAGVMIAGIVWFWVWLGRGKHDGETR